MKINELNQQVAHLQEQNQKLQLLTAGVSHESYHDSNQEFQLSVEHQFQGHSDQPALLQEKVKALELELQVLRSTLENERKKYEEKLSELEQQLSISLSQVKQHG